MKKLLANVVMVAVLSMAGMAEASLTNIGSATYGGNSYNLIYDNGSSLIWLDYSKADGTWQDKVAWASSLGSNLTNITLKPGYSVNWSGDWRLPASVAGAYTYGVNGTGTYGYNITSSELGHLFYTELGNKGYFDTSGDRTSGYGLAQKGPFANLKLDWYWSGQAYNSDYAFALYTNTGYQDAVKNGYEAQVLGMAVHSATVTPIPAAAWLLGSGLIGLVGLRRKKMLITN